MYRLELKSRSLLAARGIFFKGGCRIAKLRYGIKQIDLTGDMSLWVYSSLQ